MLTLLHIRKDCTALESSYSVTFHLPSWNKSKDSQEARRSASPTYQRESNTVSWQREDSEKAQEIQAFWTSVVQVCISVNSDMGVTTVCSRHQMLGHTGGHSLRRLVLIVV